MASQEEDAAELALRCLGVEVWETKLTDNSPSYFTTAKLSENRGRLTVYKSKQAMLEAIIGR